MGCEGWRICTIDDLKAPTHGAIAIGPFGSRMKSDCYVPFGVPVIRGTNISSTRGFTGEFVFIAPEFADSLGNAIVRAGDLVFPHRGSIGLVGMVPADGNPRYALSTSLMKLTCNTTKADPAFLLYFFRSPRGRHELLKHASTVGTPGIGQPLTSLRSIRLLLPPLPEQKRIAHILGTIDDKIELNRRMNATLEAMSRAIFKSWFVDFDPVRQKAAGKQPVGMDAQTAALFPDSFEDSEIGEVPKGWRVGCILEQASLLSGGTPKTDEPSYWGGGIPWASAKDVSQCGEAFLTTTERSITQVGIDNSSTRIIPAHTTVIVSRGATTGRLTMLASDMAMNQTCYGLHSRIDAPLSLYCCAQSFISRMVAAAHGSVFDTITTKTFETTPVLLVPPRNLAFFDGTLADVFARVRSNLVQSRTLATLRDTLLPKLLSGEVRVPEAEEAVGEVLG